MPTFDGTVTLNGSGVGNAAVYVINDTTNSVAAVATTDSTGAYSVSVADGDTYHLAVQYDDGSNYYNSTSDPYLSSNKTVDFSLSSYSPPSSTAVDFTLSRPVPIVEDWESQDLTNWNGGHDYTSGDYQFNTSVQYEGSACLEDAHSDGLSHIYSNPGDGLPNYISYPARFRWYARANQDNNGGARVYFAVHNNGDTGFETQFGFTNDVIHLGAWKSVSNGSTNWRKQGSASFTNDHWYYGELVWDDGTYGGNAGDITWTVYDAADDTKLGSISNNDTSWTSYEGVMVSLWSDSTSHSCYNDYIYLY